jgi:tetrahydromethanopterin S-methyltransferase subunit G
MRESDRFEAVHCQLESIQEARVPKVHSEAAGIFGRNIPGRVTNELEIVLFECYGAA